MCIYIYLAPCAFHACNSSSAFVYTPVCVFVYQLGMVGCWWRDSMKPVLIGAFGFRLIVA